MIGRPVRVAVKYRLSWNAALKVSALKPGIVKAKAGSDQLSQFVDCDRDTTRLLGVIEELVSPN